MEVIDVDALPEVENTSESGISQFLFEVIVA